jgi:two-component system, cell cycle sensor histidine kinase and response regulator CckA
VVDTGSVAHGNSRPFVPAQGPGGAGDVADQLAGGVAHDFNNLLTAILGFVDLLSMRTDLPEDAREDIEEIAKAGRMAASLTGRLLVFSRRRRSEPRIIDLNQVISGLEARLRRLLGESIVLDLALDSGLETVFADAGQIEQAILQLALNARQATPASGRVTITTANLRLAGDDLPGQPGSGRGGAQVMLSIADTGLGMDATAIAQLFESAFTAGSRGKGIGLGLATVRGIVETSRGAIGVRSATGQGSTFTICLPVCRAAGAAAAGAAVAP